MIKEYARKRKEMSPEQEKAIKLWLAYRHTVLADRIRIHPLRPFGTRVEYSILFPGEHVSKMFSGKRAGKKLTDIQESEF